MLLPQSIGMLYELSQRTSLHDFPVEMLRILHDQISFDLVALCAGRQDPAGEVHFRMVRKAGNQGDLVALEECADLTGDAPNITELFNILDTHLEAARRIRPPDSPFLQSGVIHRNQQVFQFLFCAATSNEENPAYWIILLRTAAPAFNDEDFGRLRTLWDHIWRATDINRSTGLNLHDTILQQRASAIVCRNGAIEVADPGFTDLIGREWPTHCKRCIPLVVLDRIRNLEPYYGKSIEISSKELSRYLLCHARAFHPMPRITPAETAVARLFAAGKSHKEIASELRVSPNTVRSQIANLYSKLDVHDKAALAQKLMTDLRSLITIQPYA
jgi:DNA-binding CsgD family transcriptional regulator